MAPATSPSGYVTYTGSDSHSARVEAGNVTQTVIVDPGQTIHLDPTLANALPAAEPDLWEPATGFPNG